MPDSARSLLWTAYEHEHIPRSSEWFWALGITAACLAFIAILFGDVLFGVVIIIAAGTLGLLAIHPPELVEFEISAHGIRVGTTTHRWTDVISFWVEEHDGTAPILLVDTTAFMAPNLVIPLPDVDVESLRNTLREYTDEVPMQEPIAHKVLEFFGF